MKDRRRDARGPVLILIAIIAFASIASNWVATRAVPASDFYQFWVVGQELSAGRAGDVYSDRERERIRGHYLDRARASGERGALRTARQRSTLETFSTPFLYTVFATFSSGDYDRDLVRFRALALASSLFAVLVLCRLLGYGAPSTIAALALFGSWFAPTRSDWFVGNVNSFQLASLSLFLWLSCRSPTVVGYLLGGFLLGSSAMFKPNSTLVILSLLVAWGLARRREKLVFVCAGMALAAVLAFVWSCAVFHGTAIWKDWFIALSALPDDIITVELGNYAPARLVADWLHVDPSIGFGVVCGGLLLGVMVRVFRRSQGDESRDRAGLEDLHVVALAGLVTLLSSPLAWLHYFVATIPMLLIVLGPAADRARRGRSRIVQRTLAWTALVAVMMRPFVVLDLGDDRSRAIALCVGTAILFGLGMRALLDLAPATKGEGDAGR